MNPRKNVAAGRPPFPKWLVITALAVLVACVMIPKINWTHIRDQILASQFEPTAEISAIESSLDLTSYASVIFLASKPVLEDNANFNAHCESYDVEISVLGCYTNDTIYLYDIDTSSNNLDGIIESTAAHELLHAVWARLSDSDKATLTSSLEAVYSENATQFDDELDSYDESERLEEIYARVGTEIKDLPGTLENHFANYFNDQDAIVDYYDSYNAAFETLQAEFNELTAEMEALYSEIETARVEIEDLAETDVDAANTLVRETNLKINRYNELVEEYNQNILRTEELNAAVNSNS